MKQKLVTLYLLLLPLFVFAQSPADLVKSFFRAMSTIDTLTIKQMSIEDAQLCTSTSGRTGSKSIECIRLKNFTQSLKGFQRGELDEQIRDISEHVTDRAATVSMEYDFFFKGKFSHCGVNVFHFLHSDTGWKITGIDDTRRKNDCMGEQKAAAELLLDGWHAAATKADSAAYFNALADDAIFIGTDSSEVWTKQEFLAFAAPYFKKGKAWDFVKISRNLHFDGKRKMIWFDEMLDTWMGPCRGSGWIAIEGSQLYIQQYVLSLTVPNDKIESVLQAIGAQRRKRG